MIFCLIIILFSGCSNIETNTTHSRNSSDTFSQITSCQPSETTSEPSSDVINNNEIRHDTALYKLLLSNQAKYIIRNIKIEKTASVILHYPQISGLDDKKLEGKINDQIKHNIFNGDFPEYFVKENAEFMPERDIIKYDELEGI